MFFVVVFVVGLKRRFLKGLFVRLEAPSALERKCGGCLYRINWKDSMNDKFRINLFIVKSQNNYPQHNDIHSLI